MTQIVLPLIFVLAFLGAVLLVQALASVFFSARERSQRVNRRLTLLESGMDRREVYESLVRRPTAPAFGGLAFAKWYDWASTYCRQAGLSITPMTLISYTGIAILALWGLAVIFLRATGVGGFAELAFAFVGACGVAVMAVWTWLSGTKNKRDRTLEEQLPLALDIIIRSVRAGHPVVSAVQLVTEEMADPIGSEFGLIVDETTYGIEFREALRNFARRTGSDDAHFFAVSVGIQAETGGNLAEILAGLASVIRGRIMLGRRIKALSSEGRMSALILSGLPIFLISSIMLTQPGFYTSKLDHPVFWPFVFGIFCLYMFGQWMMRRIVNFKY